MVKCAYLSGFLCVLACNWVTPDTCFFICIKRHVNWIQVWVATPRGRRAVLRGQPLKNNLYGVAAVGIAVRGCVGRPLSLEIGVPVLSLVLASVVVRKQQKQGCSKYQNNTRGGLQKWLASCGVLWQTSTARFMRELYRVVILGCDTDTSWSLYWLASTITLPSTA